MPRHTQSVLNLDFMDPNDSDRLKDLLKSYKQELNRYKDENRLLLTKAE